MNEKFFIHLMSMQLASILTRLARHSGIAAMSFLHSLKLWGVVVVAFVALAPMGLAEAQEREKPVEILDATQGNYRLVVNILPRVPAVGPINFTVFPTSAKDRAPIRDAEITLVSHDAEGVPKYQVKALNTPSTQGEYVGNLVIKSAGAWSIHIEVVTEELGTEVFVAPISVAPAAVGSTPEAGLMMLL